MITLEEFYNKVMSDRDEMAEFVKASGTDTLAEFAESRGCKATELEIRKYFLGKCADKLPEEGEGEISDDELENVSGGSIFFFKWMSGLFSTLFGGACAEVVSPQRQSTGRSTTVQAPPTPCPMPTIMSGAAPGATNAVLNGNPGFSAVNTIHRSGSSDATIRLC
jgi:hypothetical protein